jgi:peroxiredoxin Q/BCP
MIGIGDLAPDFELPAASGGSVRLSALRPGRAVVFFDPRDNTPACTDEACAFSDASVTFAARGVTLLGISKDSLTRHRNFARKYGLTVTLLSDAGSTTCEDWGVWQQKVMFGRPYMGIVRSTFLIGTDGRVGRVWSPVHVDGHVAEVLQATA